MLQSPQGVPARQEIPLTEPHTPALALNAKYPKRPKLDGVVILTCGILAANLTFYFVGH